MIDLTEKLSENRKKTSVRLRRGIAAGSRALAQDKKAPASITCQEIAKARTPQSTMIEVKETEKNQAESQKELRRRAADHEETLDRQVRNIKRILVYQT